MSIQLRRLGLAGAPSPHRLICGQDNAFKSCKMAIFLKKWRVCRVLSSAEHPETNGLDEKVNETLAYTFAAFVNVDQDAWDDQIPEAVFCINTAKQSTTEITPFELVYGRSAVLAQHVFPCFSLACDERGNDQRSIEESAPMGENGP